MEERPKKIKIEGGKPVLLSLFYDANGKHYVTLCQTNLDLFHTNKLTEAADPHLDALPLNWPDTSKKHSVVERPQ